LKDLFPYRAADPEEDAWLERLAVHLVDSDHVVRVRPGPARQDDEDEPALARGADGRWWAGRFIGELNFEGREVRIEPRLGVDVVGVWLARAMNLAILPKAATAHQGGPLIAQLLDRVWSAAVADAARHGPPRFRLSESLVGPYVRGPLDVSGTIALRSRRVPYVASRRQGRTLDNPVSQVIVLADRTLSSLLPPEKPWRPEQCDAVLGQLRGEVGSRPALPRPLELRKVRYTPITRGFERVAELSSEIARRRGTLTSAGAADTSGVLIDVAELWELFLVHCARRAFGAARVEHGTATAATGFLMASEVDEARRLGRLKPDLVIRGGERDVAVIDAKYKRLHGDLRRLSGVDRGDLYQLAAYLSGHEVGFGALAYPPPVDGDDAEAERYGPWALRSGEVARFVRLSAVEDECVAELRELVPS
jgi:5-methylcytosine-specific restriction enzyme subunit McrC